MDTPSPPAFTLREALASALGECNLQTTPDPVAHVVVFDSSHWWAYREQAEDELSSAERERAHRFRQPRHRDTYLLAHAVWRLVIAHSLDVAPKDVPLASEDSGRPYLPGTGLATSLSHSDSHVAIAVAHAECIGVDIERTPPRFRLHELTTIVCTADEAAALHPLDPASREAALLALWTRKEALLKAFGLGLRQPPSTLAVRAGVAVSPPPAAAQFPACVVHEFGGLTDIVGALAAPIGISDIRLHHLH